MPVFLFGSSDLERAELKDRRRVWSNRAVPPDYIDWMMFNIVGTCFDDSSYPSAVCAFPMTGTFDKKRRGQGTIIVGGIYSTIATTPPMRLDGIGMFENRIRQDVNEALCWFDVN